ncbi:peptide-methionine (S)-S-oxide reductase MsrA [Lactobacillus sp. ESL0679]|uniref:peptide-methionine (S)-S-oxide reductase MsrA n=1 Tax=Lactobacillus sp. ESL0679 TaxID=2983209 RepID=UPI0023F99AA6|nr:peptide-methionine (S)-S-oxide reductase MsrA [Lactobacillus sp. ESL0679]MDF7682728.1 peptide-methionine (S)-S-oxide reductase MsrA [Lactobacillus sp. ESL0679]
MSEQQNSNQKDTAIFAGGCFWCMVKPFDSLPGVESVISGYTGGHVANPTYEQVCAGDTRHTEAVRITFDPQIMPYKKLLEYYWQVTDPTDASGQFQDRGDNYRPVIFYNSPEQKGAAEQSRDELANSGKFDKPIVTEIEPASDFYEAEYYHQDFYKKDPLRYSVEEAGGRENFIKEHWGK